MASVKLVYGLLFVAFLVANVQAELDIDELERDLQNSDWTEEPIVMDDSEEHTGRNGLHNPVCSCMHHLSSCGCCIGPKIYGMKFLACINATMHTSKTQNIEIVEVAAHLLNMKVTGFNFSATFYDQICTKMRIFSFISVCIHNNNTSTQENGFVNCPTMDLMIGKTAAASIQFSCFQFKDKEIAFYDNENAAKSYFSYWFSIKVKSPFERVVRYMQITGIDK